MQNDDKHCSADNVDAIAKTIWLSEFERAFSRTPSDPWENQSDKIKDGHRLSTRLSSFTCFEAQLYCVGCVAQEAPSLNREGREHPSYDNPRDPFAVA
jgi:hypothetical protein